MAILKYKNKNGEFVPLIEVEDNSANVLQGTGDSEKDVMSQDSITKELNKKHDKLISGVNIATINGESLLGSGNIQIDIKVDPRETLRVVLNSNQIGGIDGDLIGAKIKVTGDGLSEEKTWDGSSIIFYIEPGTSYTVSVSEIPGYKKPKDATYEAVMQGNRTHTFTFLTELLNVSLSSDDDSDVSSQKITVSTISGDLTSRFGKIINYKIPFDTIYKVSVNNKDGYIKPQDKSFTANQANRTLNLEYIKINSGKIKISKTISDPSSMITTEGDEALQILLSKFRRCLAKSTEDNKIKICYLNNSNSNYYPNGTNATLTGAEGDVMVYFPEFWYLGTDSDNEWVFNISLSEIEGYKHAPASLVGAYKGYVEGGKLYSRSWVKRTTGNYRSDMISYARNRGAGYHIIDYQQHCIIAWMFYARYKRTDSRNVCGTGEYYSEYPSYNGTTNTLGITDTTANNAGVGSNMLVNFLGLEGCWGQIYEWIEGIHYYKNYPISDIIIYDKGDYHDLSEDEIISPSKRVLTTQDYNYNDTGYINKIKGGEYMDIIPIDNTLGTESTYFCDIYMESASADFNVFLRSGYTYKDDRVDITNQCGVSVMIDYEEYSSLTIAVGTRLAFDGEITVIEPDEFRKIIEFR